MTLLRDASIDELVAEIQRRGDGVNHAEVLQRGKVVHDASNDVHHLRELMASDEGQIEGNYVFRYCDSVVDFQINEEKRAVTALVRGSLTGDLLVVGVAKCDPNDCFNEHIGKAIALRRALGLDVPDEYLNAPQPEGVEIGDKIRVYHTNGPGGRLTGSYFEETVEGFLDEDEYYLVDCEGFTDFEPADGDRVIDDTNRY